jgi:hypothetical protein
MEDIAQVLRELSSPTEIQYNVLFALCLLTAGVLATLHDVELSQECKKTLHAVFIILCCPVPFFWVTTTGMDHTSWFDFWSGTTVWDWFFHVLFMVNSGVMIYTCHTHLEKIDDDNRIKDYLIDYLTLNPDDNMMDKFISMLCMTVFVIITGSVISSFIWWYKPIVAFMSIASALVLVFVHGLDIKI